MTSREQSFPIRYSPLPIRCLPPLATRYSLFASLRLQSTLHTCVDCVERCRAADVESVSLLTAEAQVGDSFRDVDLAEQLAVPRVAAHAVLFRIAPAHRAPDTPLRVTAHPVGDAWLGHVSKNFAVRRLSAHIQIEHANM